jgi:hypothetical protein
MTNAWQPVEIVPADQVEAARREEEKLNAVSTYRLCYTHEGGMYSRNVEGTGAWFLMMKKLVGKSIEGYGILTYIGPPV